VGFTKLLSRLSGRIRRTGKPVNKRHLMRNTTEIGLDRWHSRSGGAAQRRG
jgi:hypothetical protein